MDTRRAAEAREAYEQYVSTPTERNAVDMGLSCAAAGEWVESEDGRGSGRFGGVAVAGGFRLLSGALDAVSRVGSYATNGGGTSSAGGGYYRLAEDRRGIFRLEGWVRRHMRKCFWLRWHGSGAASGRYAGWESGNGC